MLQRNPDTLVRSAEHRPAPMSPADLLSSLTSLVRRRAGIMGLIFTVTMVCGVIYLIVSTPKFLATASLLIDTRKSQLFQQNSVIGDATIDSTAVDSQIEVLKSDTIAAAVVKQLHLATDPEFGGA